MTTTRLRHCGVTFIVDTTGWHNKNRAADAERALVAGLRGFSCRAVARLLKVWHSAEAETEQRALPFHKMRVMSRKIESLELDAFEKAVSDTSGRQHFQAFGQNCKISIDYGDLKNDRLGK